MHHIYTAEPAAFTRNERTLSRYLHYGMFAAKQRSGDLPGLLVPASGLVQQRAADAGGGIPTGLQHAGQLVGVDPIRKERGRGDSPAARTVPDLEDLVAADMEDVGLEGVEPLVHQSADDVRHFRMLRSSGQFM